MFKKIRAAILSLAALAVFAAAGQANAALIINGAGGTFPYPLYSKWFTEYSKVDPAVRFNYQAIGSGAGIKQITAQTVDFGASDKALSNAELAAAPGKLLHIPTVMGAIVMTYNLPGIGTGLKLTPEVISGIYLGQITKWNDPRIAAVNKGLRLPNAPIVVVHRSDGSGTTSIFTNYLCSVSNVWKQKVGTGTSVNWPVGLGGKGNQGVSGQVKNTRFSVGYVELAYAFENKLPYAYLKNRSGYFVAPSLESTSAAAAGAASHMPADYRIELVNQPGKNAYPIAGFTYLLVYQQMKNHEIGENIVKFLKWELKTGQKMAPGLLYSPLPANVNKMVLKTVESIKY